MGLTDAAALAQEPEQYADPASKVFVMIFGMRSEWSADLKSHVIDAEGAMATDTVAILGVLARVAAPAGHDFAVANRGEKLKSRHGFPWNMLKGEVSE